MLLALLLGGSYYFVPEPFRSLPQVTMLLLSVVLLSMGLHWEKAPVASIAPDPQ